jgi:hypothetical protein
MEKFSKEELMLIKDVLIKARDQSDTAGFDMEKLVIDSFGSSDQKHYDHLLRKIEDAIKHMNISD